MHTGIGLRHAHFDELLRSAPALAFVEVHSENYFGDGGAALQLLEAARARYPVSLHGVGLALGSAAGIDPVHLERLARLVRRIDPVRVSDHASFARAPRRNGQPAVSMRTSHPISARSRGCRFFFVRRVDSLATKRRNSALITVPWLCATMTTRS